LSGINTSVAANNSAEAQSDGTIGGAKWSPTIARGDNSARRSARVARFEN
jgi:hypothetical protein